MNDVGKTSEPETREAFHVRSSLERLETIASQVVHRLESVKVGETRENQSATDTSALPEKLLPSEILTKLETLIAHPAESNPEELAEYPLPPIDDVSHLVLVSQSITSYLRYLNRKQLMKLTTQILGDTYRWFGTMFKFPGCQASFHNDSSECLVRAIRLALVSKFPAYFEKGVRSLPEVVIYVSEAASHLGLQYACCQIGLPINSIRVVGSITTNEAPIGLSVIDVGALQKSIAGDVKEGRTPLFVLADVGTAVLGESDNVARIQEICATHKIWCHLRGNSLAALILAQGGPEAVADSLTINLNNWFGVPGVQTVLLHRAVSPSVLFDSDPLHSRYLSAVGVWMMIQALGKEQIVERVLTAFTAVREFHSIIAKVSGLAVLSKPPGQVPLVDLIQQPTNLSLIFESAVPAVVFKFTGAPRAEGPENPEPESAYVDRLNSWLGQILQRDSSQIDLEIIELPAHGTCIRFCPLELGVGELPPNEEYLASFSACIDAQVEILRATTKHRDTFNRLVRDNPFLELIELEDWAGLGGVRYIPEFFDQEANENAKSELDKLNRALVDHLRATDSAFSLGESQDELTCVRFGMVTEDTDVVELLELVIDAGKAIQEDSRVLDSMSEMVKKGIEAATLELQKENEEKLWQEGILRHVPVVGHFVNWFSPPMKEAGVKGRSLNLQQGVVESTENIYKYHMQLPGGKSQTLDPANSSHSRSESQSSSTSNANKIVVSEVKLEPARNESEEVSESVVANDT